MINYLATPYIEDFSLITILHTDSRLLLVLARATRREGLGDLIDQLDAFARDCNRLEVEAASAIEKPAGERDAEAYHQALIGRGEIIRDLPTNCSSLLAGVDCGIADVITEVLTDFSGAAEAGLSDANSSGRFFKLDCLLIPKGSKDGDPNDLEILVAQLRHSLTTDCPK